MPNRASLRTGRAKQASGAHRQKLVAAAVALADREGLPAVSIRRVATELAVGPMSIYTYITSKDELLDLMAETVVGEVLLDQPPSEDWRTAVEAIALRSHRTFVAHPWLAAVSQHRPNLGTNAVHHAEQLLAAIAPLNLSPEDAWEVLFLINDYTLGHALRLAFAPPPEGGSYPPFDAEQFPHLTRTLSGGRRRSTDTFLAGLRRLLDGIETSRGVREPKS